MTNPNRGRGGAGRGNAWNVNGQSHTATNGVPNGAQNEPSHQPQQFENRGGNNGPKEDSIPSTSRSLTGPQQLRGDFRGGRGHPRGASVHTAQQEPHRAFVPPHRGFSNGRGRALDRGRGFIPRGRPSGFRGRGRGRGTAASAPSAQEIAS